MIILKLKKYLEIFFISLGIFLILSIYSSPTILAGPSGANMTFVNSSTAPIDAPTSVPAQAGNVTELNINGFSTTQSWQGYFGNITGTIQLADSGSNVMFNWSDLSPRGEIYASTNISINWPTLMCFNFSTTGDYNPLDNINNGSTSLYGTNLSQLEDAFNIKSDDVDGVNETFNLIGPNTHNSFFSSNLNFSEGECPNTRIYSNAGKGENDKFEEVLMYEPNTKSIVFTSLLNSDVLGFDGRSHDFEMLVLEDGHATNRATTPYYFYLELQ